MEFIAGIILVINLSVTVIIAFIAIILYLLKG